MEQLNINNLLNRDEEEKLFIDTLRHFEKNKKKLITKRGIYVYGEPGTGKTMFVKNILKKLNYDIIHYDAGDIRNKSVIENITKEHISEKNVLSMFNGQNKNIVIVMDEIDGMNNGDKGGITTLIKLIRPKKTKKQKLEHISMIPIVCIGNFHVDKKIKDMKRVCINIKLNTPTREQVTKIMKLLIPDFKKLLINDLIDYIQGDLRKIKAIYELYTNHNKLLKKNIIKTILLQKNHNENTKEIIKILLNNSYDINKHSFIMNETDRTSIGLLYHENIIDVIKDMDVEKSLPFYIKILENICFSDNIDRITFQKQIWIFNEMSSLIKTFYNNHIYHNTFKNKSVYNPQEVRFTKVLTKYSTEYNNNVFLISLCFKFNMDKKDLISYFIYLKKNLSMNEIELKMLNENLNVNKLDIQRLYKYIDKLYTVEDNS